MDFQQTIGRMSERYQVSAEAVATLAEAMRRGGNKMAQFSHSELGGHGQWLPGMTQIGDMFNRELRTRVERLCVDLSKALEDESHGNVPEAAPHTAYHGCGSEEKPFTMKPMKPLKPMTPMEPMHGMESGPKPRWWPEDLGDSPASAGGQNEMRYAYFADRHRLAVDEGSGKITVYDTGGHTVSGVRQDQGGSGRTLVFRSGQGEMDLGSLRQV